MWPIRLFAAVLLLPLAALAARTADGIARVVVARLRGAPLPPVRDAAGLASPDTIGPMGSDAPSYRAASPLSISLLSISSLSGVLALASFLFIPPGRFPAVLGTDIDIVLIPTLLLLSGWAGTAGRRSPWASLWGWALPVAAVIGSASWVAWRKGMPGAPLGLAVFVTRSVWSVTEGAGALGLSAVAAATALVLPLFKLGDDEGPASARAADSIRGLAMAALGVSLFAPFSTLDLFERGGFLMAVVDLPLFWVKAVLARAAAGAFFGRLSLRLGLERAARFCFASAAGLALAGGLLVLTA
ncbi:hypothetical protein [uncultured Fretibacterium sp.]|uniref:hypothetical protein n=1 Tax=uncultured Fretibacterium sp. TaxID=1678694 RepID=UPI0026242F9C|nr:hypothetical protein [uncultured Fretibacterium sp.]